MNCHYTENLLFLRENYVTSYFNVKFHTIPILHWQRGIHIFSLKKILQYHFSLKMYYIHLNKNTVCPSFRIN